MESYTSTLGILTHTSVPPPPWIRPRSFSTVPGWVFIGIKKVGPLIGRILFLGSLAIRQARPSLFLLLLSVFFWLTSILFRFFFNFFITSIKVKSSRIRFYWLRVVLVFDGLDLDWRTLESPGPMLPSPPTTAPLDSTRYRVFNKK